MGNEEERGKGNGRYGNEDAEMDVCVFTRRDTVKNEKVRALLGVRRIEEKLKRDRLRWYGHVQRREENDITRKVQRIEVKGQRGGGRPELRWADVLKKDLKDLDLKPETAMNGEHWRSKTHYGDPKELGQTQRQ